MLYTAETSRFFNAETIERLGYMQYSTISSDSYFIKPSTYEYIVKFVSQTKVEYYPFKWIDTSSVSLFEFGQEFFNYRLNSQTKRSTDWLDGTLLEINYVQSQVQE